MQVLGDTLRDMSPRNRMGLWCLAGFCLLRWVLAGFSLWAFVQGACWIAMGSLLGYFGVQHKDMMAAKALAVGAIVLGLLSMYPVISWSLVLHGLLWVAVIGAGIYLAFFATTQLRWAGGGGCIVIALVYPRVLFEFVLNGLVWVVVGGVGAWLIIIYNRKKEEHMQITLWAAAGVGGLIATISRDEVGELVLYGISYMVLGFGALMIGMKWQTQWVEETAAQKRKEEKEREERRRKNEEERLINLLDMKGDPTFVDMTGKLDGIVMIHRREECLKRLFTSLGNSTSVQRLVLRKNDITDIDVIRLAAALKSNTSLRVLDLRENGRITKQGIQPLTEALRYNDHPLQELHLPDIPDVERYLLETLRSNYSLTAVTIEGRSVNSQSSKSETPRELDALLQRNSHMGSVPFIDRSSSADLHGLWAHLTQVILTNSRLTVIPSELFELQKLQVLDLRKNAITSFAAIGLSRIPQLEFFYLSHNELESLPADLKDILSLKALDVRHNPQLREYAGFYEGKQLDELKGWLEEFQSGSERQNVIKVMLVGEGQAGKTSIVKCLLGQGVKGVAPRTIQTDGIDIHPIKVKNIEFQCWDFAGQHLYRMTHQFFISSQSVFLIVFNLVDFQMDAIQYWWDSIVLCHANQSKSVQAKPLTFLVGTRKDDPKCTEEYLKNVENQLIKTVKCAHFRVVSCLQPHTIMSLRKDIAAIAEERKLVGTTIPKNFKNVQTYLNGIRSQRPLITMDALTDIIAKERILGENRRNIAISFLERTGTIVHFNWNRRGSANFVVIDPSFLITVMKCIISVRNVLIKEGIFLAKDIPTIFYSISTLSLDLTTEGGVVEFVLRILTQFDLLFPLPSSKYLVPWLLPVCPIKSFHFPMFQVVCERVWDFQFVPQGFFSHLIARCLPHKQLAVEKNWRDVLILSTGSCKIVVRMTSLKRDYLLFQLWGGENTTAGESARVIRVFSNVVDVLVADWYPSAKPRIHIGCPSCNVPHFDRQQCSVAMSRQEDNQPAKLQCPTTEAKVEVQKIAPDLAMSDLIESSFLFSDSDLDFTVEAQEKETKKKKAKEKEKERSGKGEEKQRCLLGKGGFGVVYKARLLRNNGVMVAVKEITQAETSEAELSEFHHEIWMMSCFWHPHVVRFYGVCLHPLRIVMEFMAGGSLESFLHKQIKDPAIGPADPQWELRIQLSLDIARGVKAMHSHNPPIIHRDINSRNILLTSKGRAKIADLGTATVLPFKHLEFHKAITELRWMPPEIIDEKPYDTSADIYSCGIVFWEILTCQVPFQNLQDKHLSVIYEMISKGGRPQLPIPTDKEGDLYITLIKGCWDQIPAKRKTASEVVAVLEMIRSTIVGKQEATQIQNPLEGVATISLDTSQFQTIALRDHPLIGGGNYGEVYKVSVAEKTVAIKKIFRLDDFQSEVNILKELHHPFLVRQLGFYQGEWEHWIVMEFMECGDLQSYLAQFDRKGIQPSSLALQLSSNVLEGLSFLHSHNIIHRDLKPANILLSNIHGSLIAKIADFGIATIYDGSDSMGMVGTPRYMAPEVSKFMPYDHKADIFSFAMIEFEILFGDHHLSALDGYGALRAIKNGDRPMIPTAHRAEYSLALKTTIKRAWNVLPSMRPKAQEFLHRIRKEQNNEGEDEEDNPEVERGDGDVEDPQLVREAILNLLQSSNDNDNLEKVKSKPLIDQDGDSAVLREIKTQERSQSVEEVGVVEVKEESKVGSITCLLSARELLPEYLTWSTWLAGTQRPIVVGGTSRGYLLCWNEKSQCVAQMKVHEGRINYLLGIVSMKAVVSGGNDKRIHLWCPNLKKKKAFIKWSGHGAPLICMIQWGERLISSSMDRFLFSWDLKGEIQQRRQMDSDITAFALENQFLWAGTTDGTIQVLNKELQTIQQIKAHGYGVGSILNVRGQMWSSSYRHDIRVWTKSKDDEGWKMAAHLEGGHKGSVFQLLLAHGYVWSEAADGSRMLWKPFMWEYEGHVVGKEGCVGSAVAGDIKIGEDEGFIWVSCSHQKKQHIHIWRIRHAFLKDSLEGEE